MGGKHKLKKIEKRQLKKNNEPTGDAQTMARLKERMARYPTPAIIDGEAWVPFGTVMECMGCGQSWVRRNYSLFSPRTGIRCARCHGRDVLAGGIRLVDFPVVENEKQKEVIDMAKKLKVDNGEPKKLTMPSEAPPPLDDELPPEQKKAYDEARKKGTAADAQPLSVKMPGESYTPKPKEPSELPPLKLPPVIAAPLPSAPTVPRMSTIPARPAVMGTGKTIDGQAVVGWDRNAVENASRTVTSLITYLGEKIAQEDSPPELVEPIAEALAMVLWQNKHLLEASQYMSMVFLAIAVGRYLIWSMEARKKNRAAKDAAAKGVPA